jgi:hypothetical protein
MKRRFIVAGTAALCAVVAAGLVVGGSRGAGGLSPCTATQLVPQLGDVTINQGVGSYATERLARGKDTLVRFYLTLPSVVGTSCNGSINVTSANMTVTSGAGTFSTNAFQSFGSTGSAIAASSVTVDSNADPKFVIPGQDLNHCLVDITVPGNSCDDTTFFQLTFRATITYTTSAPSTGTRTFTAVTASPNPIVATVEQKTNALRILVVPMGDASLGRTSQWSTTAQNALINGFNTMSRLYPVEFGISNDLAVATGGLRYTIDPGLLNLKSVAGTYDPNGKFCGTSSNFNGIKGLLDTFLTTYNSNPANAAHPADKVLGVADSLISDGSTSAYNCAEGMAATSSGITGTAATEAWVRAIPDVAATKSQPAQPSLTGAAMAMEIAHTMAQERFVSGVNTTYHSLNTNADLTAPDRGYNVSSRSYVAGPHSAMRFVTPWNNNNTDMEENDFESLLCNLGGGLSVDCTAPQIGGTPAPVGNSFMISGTTDFTPGGTHVVESFAATGAPVNDPATSDLQVQFTDLTGNKTTIGIPYSTGSSVHNADLAGHVDQTAAVFGGVFAAPNGISNVELIKGGTVLYSRDAQASPPAITPDGFAPGDTTSNSVTYTTPKILPKPDIYFLADNTGSMGPSLQNVKDNINTTIGNITAQTTIGDPHFGAGSYRDFTTCPSGTAAPCFDTGYAFLNSASILAAGTTDDGSKAKTAINAWVAGGGGDRPEGQLFALSELAAPTDPTFNPNWRSDSSKIVVWFGDNPGHDPICAAIRGAPDGTPDITAASTASALRLAGIRVIAVSVNTDGTLVPSLGLDGERLGDSTPDGAGQYQGACGATVNSETGQASTIVKATGGSFQSAADATQVTNAILAGLHNLPAQVTPSPTCDPGLSMLFDGLPASDAVKTVTSGDDVKYAETINIGSDVVAGATLHCDVKFLVNGNLDPNFTQPITIRIRSGNQIGFTSTAPDPSVLTGHVNYDCGNGEQIPLAVGLAPTISGNTATFSFTYEPSPICPGKNHDATITPVVTNGIQTSTTSFTTHVTTQRQPPVAAIYAPFDADASALSPFPLNGLVTDADDGILAAHWAIAGPGVSLTASGNKADVLPPGGVWSPGDYTITLTGTDSDGNTATATRHVSVVKYQFGGFLSPVDNPPIVNAGTAGRTYPVKFALLSLPSLTLVTDTSVVTAIRSAGAPCGLEPQDPLETTATGTTSLRNDGTQFIYNWATPSKPGCYTLMVTLDDGTTHVAWFNFK